MNDHVYYVCIILFCRHLDNQLSFHLESRVGRAFRIIWQCKNFKFQRTMIKKKKKSIEFYRKQKRNPVSMEAQKKV
ncbi:hypothetical protein Glove_487g62 [Diversispora epigaea]|uniref:Uncharacterized protein n=1 Tax=Diversispora epigaea TaxID=1348612 RepID=A0A397GPI0_9GLOM|nr:hypothetical protein Glove_487g62 [Diversispora epigaea]